MSDKPDELQIYIDNIINNSNSDDLFETVKNTIDGMLNCDPECHQEMTVFCFQALYKLFYLKQEGCTLKDSKVFTKDCLQLTAGNYQLKY